MCSILGIKYDGMKEEQITRTCVSLMDISSLSKVDDDDEEEDDDDEREIRK